MTYPYLSHIHICSHCGEEFLGGKDRQFCSISCASKARDPWNKGLKGETRPYRQTGKNKVCKTCGEPYYVSHYRAKSSHYCSLKCYYQGRWPDNRETRKCVICQKQFEAMKSQKKKTCSAQCLSTHLSQIQEGDKSSCWRGGYAPYYGPNWNRQRNRARKRDNYTCQDCGITERELGRQLDVHHKKRIGDFEDKRKTNYLSNLIAYCHPCHMKAEQRKG